MRTASILLVGLLVSCATSESSKDLLPNDVQSFVERREMCDYFRGEIPDPGDVARMEAVENGVEEYCASTDKELEGLKVKYSSQDRIMEKLDSYEERIEATGE